jgi:hypothetical protein
MSFSASSRTKFFGDYYPLSPVATDKFWCVCRDLFIARGISSNNYEAIKGVLDGEHFIAIHYQFLFDEVALIGQEG